MFYVQPPKGLVTLHTLEEIVFSRLEYLNNILGSDKKVTFNGKFEYLFEGSPYDCIGHFTLRLLTLRSDGFFSSWLRKETLLLRTRLSVVNSRQLYRFFKTVVKHLKRRENVDNPVDRVLLRLCSFFMIPDIFKHIVSKSHAEDCTEYHDKIDFELLLDLVEEKAVELHKGSAVVHCSQWKELLCSLFQTFILFEVKNQSFLVNNFSTDPRMNDIWNKLQYSLFPKDYNFGNITASNIDREVQKFPPCMEHLHLLLRRKHRLSHYARLYYTLFLKECGMSLEEAIAYWKNEYSKPHKCDSVCIHNWHKDAKKFIYSIRHMYGLEGVKKNYSTPSCSFFCEEVPSTNYEGGCPFKNFDTDSLKSLLSNSMTESDLNEFMATGLKQEPQETCANFFRFKSMTHLQDITIKRPVQYYKKMLELS
ncbi:DNA primase large subunit-like [Copidosoma floridanum]|uniref:DNA primase large subunit-like n=1 Tax=Copidosoma floridanum TaxID=29053 RepID=UPI0006C9844C|nr:DNA primase large subunit-like [Copidosoma floridanum]XP_014209799.1 DNA primase large subunit-like [Copidosoma floridanum]XP_014209800.1 DNA primase large subunit-like [Copidosoma floridanum]